jgi:7-carboxy-7-deazaguanine synthase
MVVNEIFYSLQGEGRLSGVPSIFIRLAGCPLRCRWCDTKYAWDISAGTEQSPEAIVEQIKDFPTPYIVLTGGEPLIHPGITDLACLLRQQGYHLTFETAAIECPAGIPADLMSISPKLLNSSPPDSLLAERHESRRFNLSCMQELIETYPYQLKFVVDQPQDFDQIADCLERLKNVDPSKVYLMPQATNLEDYLDKSRWLAEYCLRTGFSFSPRLQVMLWGNQRGK